MEQVMEKMMEEAKLKAEDNFRRGLNCSECVVRALIDTEGLNLPPEALKYSSGFGGGVGLYGSMCGALSGAVLAVSSVHGRDHILKDDPKVDRKELLKERVPELTGEKGLYKIFNNLAAEFKTQHGSDLCRELTEPFDFGDRNRAVLCKGIIGDAAALAVKWMLVENDGSLVFVKTVKD
jgi:C_GCAxxG_C_C family probable redox protein